ncbi:MAG TPA: hypothetical protein VN645_01090, partial [Steroidobacteraceae bacterium]|nr:hypothetical protein [Steroidobacteraceae bacterium]
SRVNTLYSNEHNIEDIVKTADVVIGSVLIPGESAPKLLRREHLKAMRPGSVLVDVAVDQGGCAETTRPTTQDSPTYIEEGVVHYCVTNMPGAVPRTSTAALTHATLPYIRALADKGIAAALSGDPHFRRGLNVADGEIRSEPVARALDLPLRP